MITIVIPAWFVIFFSILFIISLILTCIQIYLAKMAYHLKLQVHHEMMEHNDEMEARYKELREERLTKKNPKHH